MMKVEIRQGNIDDATLIQEFGIRTFKETFEKFNSKENMALYIDKCFTPEQIINDMKTPGTNFFLAIADNQITGYTKTNEGPGPKELNQKKTLEIERIYVDSKFHGEGIGKSLLDKCIQLARLKNIKTVWLGVWEHNPNAIAFYKKYGFKKFGDHIFLLGRDPQTDWLMSKSVAV
jgi:ribosomal protein S18 acetylase RimI-like enzyme